jgi:general secretion pathway protein G
MKFLFLAFVLMVSDVAFAMSTQSRVTAARADILGGLKTALDRFEIDCGRYPTSAEGLAGMVNCPTNFSDGKSGGKWSGPYLDAIPVDPWGNVYVYRCPGIHNANGYDLYSCGYDGISKSGGDDLDDINNWDPHSPHGVIRSFSKEMLYAFQDSRFRIFILRSLILLILPFFIGVRFVASIFSQRVRDSIARHPIENTIWIFLSLAAFFIFLKSLPPIAG